MTERCICCGEEIPEGRQVCPSCESGNIKDSGNRREFSSGAVRDIQEGKGRCDLLPLDVVEEMLGSGIFQCIADFQETGNVNALYAALDKFSDMEYCLVGKSHAQCNADMFLEVSKHFEEGAKKYGEYNWQKGIPVNCYIDSAVRHYLKWLRGDKDEPHDRAFVWNILCCIWTVKHSCELEQK